MQPLICMVGLATVVAAAPVSAETPITKKNWRTHPRIEQIRALFTEVEAAVQAGALMHERKEGEGEPPADASREMWTDAEGVVRKFIRAGGSSDSFVTRAFFYDAQGRLRFLYVTAAAVNETRIEHRVYFDEAGKRIWEIQKTVEGPGYTFPSVWPDEDLVRDPKAAFRAP